MFYTDSPITGSEISPDQLNRTGFAERIGDALILGPSSGPLVVSLEGPWGYGKSSVINLIANHYKTIEKSSRPIIVNFNPWMAGNAENLVKEFLVQFASAVGISDKSKQTKDAAKQLLSYSKVFDVLKWVPGAEPYASIVKNVLTGVGSAADKIGELKELNISQQRDDVISALDKISKSIVVFIDDLDRLPPSEVFQMIRAVKAIADFPQTSFLLAFERSYVENALSQHGIQDASSYLDKIVQVRLHLPLISDKDINNLSIAELEKLAPIDLTSFFEGDKNRLSEVYQLSIKPLLRTPREVKRIFNRLHFVEPSLRQNVCFTDIFILEILAIKAPYVYEHIRSSPWAYHGREPGYILSLSRPEEVIKRCEAERNKVLDSIREEDIPYIRELLGTVFPLVATGFDGDSRDIDYLYARGRIAAPDRLRFALTFGLPTGEIRSEQISSFLKDVDARDEIIKNLSDDDNNIERFIELIQWTILHDQLVDPCHFIQCLAKLSACEAIARLQNKHRDILDLGPVNQLWWITKKVLEKMPAKKRVTILKTLMKNHEFISLGAYALGFLIQQQTGEDQSRQWLTENQLKVLKKFWLNSVTRNSKKCSLIDTADIRRVLFTIKEINPEKTREIIKPLLNQDESLDKLFKAIGHSGQDSVKGHYSKIKTETLAILGDAQNIRKRVKKRIQSPIEDLSLKAIYNSVLTGEPFYLIDNTKCDNL